MAGQAWAGQKAGWKVREVPYKLDCPKIYFPDYGMIASTTRVQLVELPLH